MSEKNQLQEFYQKRGLPVPTYRFEERGFDHQREYRSSLILENRKFVSPWCSKKKESEKECARLALEYLKENGLDSQNQQQTSKKPNTPSTTATANNNMVATMLEKYRDSSGIGVSQSSSSNSSSSNISSSNNSNNKNSNSTTPTTTTAVTTGSGGQIHPLPPQTKLISTMSPYDFHKLFHKLDIDGQYIKNYHEVAHLTQGQENDGLLTIGNTDNSEVPNTTFLTTLTTTHNSGSGLNSSPNSISSADSIINNIINTNSNTNSNGTTETTAFIANIDNNSPITPPPFNISKFLSNNNSGGTSRFENFFNNSKKDDSFNFPSPINNSNSPINNNNNLFNKSSPIIIQPNQSSPILKSSTPTSQPISPMVITNNTSSSNNNMISSSIISKSKEILKNRVRDIENWDFNRVGEWLESVELGYLCEIFKENEIDGKVLLLINKDDYNDLGINTFAKKKIFEKNIKELKLGNLDEEAILNIKLGLDNLSNSSGSGDIPFSFQSEKERRPLISSQINSPVPELTGTIQPRDYQIEMFKEAMEKDSIICIPTGLGKTLIGCMVLKRMQELNPTRKALFIVDRIPLVEQQSQVIFANTGMIALQAVGERFKVQRLKDNYDVLVIIGALLINLVKSGHVDLDDYSVFLFDEAHHITKEHPFSTILRTYVHHMKPKPKVIGLTASPAGKESLFQTIIAIRTIMTISKCNIIKPRESMIEPYIHSCRTETIHIPETSIESHLVKFLRHVITNFGLQVLEGSIVSDVLNGDVIPSVASSRFRDQIDQVDQFVQKLSTKIQDFRTYGSLVSYLNGKINKFKEVRMLIEKRIFKNIKSAEIQKILLSLMEATIPNTTVGYENQSKLDKALDILKNFYNELNIQFRAILFTKTRASALQLSKLMSDLARSMSQYSFIKPSCVVGHEGMTVSQQKQTIEFFRDGRCNVIVSTSVVEEGFDVPDCNLVIRMDPPNSITALIQSRGRLRNRHSYLYFLVKEGERNIYENFMKQEQYLNESIEFLVNNVIPPSLQKTNQLLPVNGNSVSAKMVVEEFCSKMISIGIPMEISFLENRVSTSPDHQPIYKCRVTLNHLTFESSGNSKKQAKENASLNILNSFALYNFLKIDNII